jgi:hypothetical protein
MKNRLATLAASLSLVLGLGAAQAQETRVVRPIVGIGLTYGGETLAEVTYNNGWVEKIKSGGLFVVHGGVEFRLGDVVDLQTTIGYHVDDSSYASNGGLRFSRYPIDVIALFRIAPQFRIGGGIQHVNSAKLAGSGDLSFINQGYESATGAVAMGEYLFGPNLGLQVRGVSQTYKPKGGGSEVDGSHIGVMLNYYFF